MSPTRLLKIWNRNEPFHRLPQTLPFRISYSFHSHLLQPLSPPCPPYPFRPYRGLIPHALPVFWSLQPQPLLFHPVYLPVSGVYRYLSPQIVRRRCNFSFNFVSENSA